MVIHVVKDVLSISEVYICYKKFYVDDSEENCIILKRYAYPI